MLPLSASLSAWLAGAQAKELYVHVLPVQKLQELVEIASTGKALNGPAQQQEKPFQASMVRCLLALHAVVVHNRLLHSLCTVKFSSWP